MNIPFRCTHGTITRAFDAANGNVAYTGLGGKPKTIIFYSTIDGSGGVHLSRGESDSVVQHCLGTLAGAIYGIDNTTCINLRNNLAEGQMATCVSMDADGFTLGWTKIGGGQNVTVKYFALF